MSDGAFLTNEARVLLCVADDRNVRMRDIAACVGVTERAAYDLLCELIERGYLSREKVGRRNRYRLHLEAVEGGSDEREQLQKLSALLGRSARTAAA